MVNIIALTLVGLTAMAGGVNAAGFRLSEQDAKANGMGNAFTAVADNASAVWYNPAAIGDLEGRTALSLGTVMVDPAMKHKYAGGSDSIKDMIHVPPYFYAAHKLNEKWGLGFGFNLPYGLSTEWEKTSRTASVATLSDIKAFNYNLNGSYKVNEELSVAVGADYVALDATLNKMLAGKELELEGSGNGWGWNAAAMYKVNDKWKLGANYRSSVKVLVNDATAKWNTFSNSASTKITLPDTFQLGAAYEANSRWLVSAGVDYTDWTTYRKVAIRSGTITQITTLFYGAGNATNTSTDTKDWKSVWAFRAGTRYKYSDKIAFTLGAFYDKNPVTEKYFETRVPDSDRIAGSIGGEYKLTEDMRLDLSYTVMRFDERSIDSGNNSIDGKYATTAQLPAIGIGYKF